MANYGPPGANRPEPWQEQPPNGAHPWRGRPADETGPWHGHGAYPPGEAYLSGPYPAEEPAYLGGEPGRHPAPPTDEPRSAGGRGRLVAVLAVLALLVLGGGAALFYLARTDTDPPATALPSATADSSEQPATQPDVPPSALAPESSADPRFAAVGECVRNEGPAGGRPKLLVTECVPKTYEVLRRFDGATSGEKDAEAKCAEVDGYTDWYFYNSELDTLDFVLCLKLR